MHRLENAWWTVSVLFLCSISSARVWLVPGDFDYIQWAIDAASDGDVISVWGPASYQPPAPPYVYPENLTLSDDKSLLIINRSFLGGPSCPPSYDSVVVEGPEASQTPVFTLERLGQGPLKQTIRGLTIQNGNSLGGGGGVRCPNGGVIRIERCRITACQAPFGGGIYFYAAPNDVRADTLYVTGCRIEDNYAGNCGGGVAADFYPLSDLGADNVFLHYDTLVGNTAQSGGAGAYLRSPVMEEEDDPKFDTTVLGCLFRQNQVTAEPDIARGGGVYFDGTWGRVRACEFTRNVPDGVCYRASQSTTFLDLGTDDSPGWNAFVDNRPWEVSHLDAEFAIEVKSNWWGTLDRDSLTRRLRSPGQYWHFAPSPLAASSKWFSVGAEYPQTCAYAVIVTGDLVVEEDASFALVGGAGAMDTMATFTQPPDYEDAAGNAGVADIVVRNGADLSVTGSQGAPYRLVGAEPEPGFWGGIILMSGSSGQFDGSEVRHAYCGILRQPQSALTLARTRVRQCQFSGVWLQGATPVSVTECGLDSNGVYGLLGSLGPGSLLRLNRLYDNGYAAMHCIAMGASSDSSELSNNTVNNEHTLAPYGILVAASEGAHDIDLDTNGLTYCTQACVSYSNAAGSFRENTVAHYGAFGVFCAAGGPHPNLGEGDQDSGLNSFSVPVGDCHYVYSEDESPVIMAEYNWWGTEYPSSEAFHNVDYDPWLTAAPGGGGQSGGHAELPERTELGECGPTPFSGRAVIRYQLAQAGNVVLSVCDAGGRVVRVLRSGPQGRGRYSTVWDGRDDLNHTVSRGVYFYRLDAPGISTTKKAVVVR